LPKRKMAQLEQPVKQTFLNGSSGGGRTVVKNVSLAFDKETRNIQKALYVNNNNSGQNLMMIKLLDFYEYPFFCYDMHTMVF